MPLVTNFPIVYTPRNCETVEDVNRELSRLATILQGGPCLYVSLAQWNAAPARPFSGMVVYADGTNWNPGAGEGVYCYYAAAWNLLG